MCTWVTTEIDLAIKYGYKIIKIFEIWHWELKGNIFEEYVNACIKEKQEASGLPEGCTNKDEYVRKYFAHEGIQLDSNNIEFNAGARSVSKIKANSLWGFFAINNNKTKHKYILYKAELLEMLNNDEFIIHEIIDYGKYAQIYYSTSQEYYHYGNLNANVVIAAFVTAYGRIKLYSEICKLGNRLLYCDTDSMIFISRPDEYEPETGPFLGELTNEISNNKYIVEFCSAGPKNYSFKLNDATSKTTIKGFTQNSVTNQKINFDSIKNIVCEEQGKKIDVQQHKFSRDKTTWTVKTEDKNKLYSFVYDKRILNDDLSTTPYGF